MKRRIWLATVATIVAALCSAAIVYAVAAPSPDEMLGADSRSNALTTFALFVGWPSGVVAVVAWTRLGVPKGSATPPRRVAVVTGAVWMIAPVALGAAIILGRSFMQETVPQWVSFWVVMSVVVALPALLWLPIWAVASAVRARRPAPARPAPWITEP